MMRRDECLKLLARHHTDEIVVPVYQAAFEWRAIKPDSLIYLGVGAMGQASSHALGLALGRPDKRVIVLDGDGSLLMNLGSMVTIAEVAPRNLFISSARTVLTKPMAATRFPAPVASASPASRAPRAIAASTSSRSLRRSVKSIGAVLKEEGPVFVVLKVVAGATYPQDFAAVHSAELRRQFAAALSRQ
jgi:phosphonopyruvate decarboxylase